MSDVEGTAVEEPLEADVVGEPQPSMALAPFDPAAAGSVIRAEKPTEIVVKATEIANSLKDLIEAQGLAVNVGGRRKHVEVGGWQALGTMLGALGGQPLHAETVWTRPARHPETGELLRHRYTATVKRYHRREQGGGLREEVTYDVDGHDWEACVEIRTASGVVVGRAEAMCSRSEETWNQREDFALRSMAETRAESRAYRRAVGWIVNIAGYNPTPAEEMGHTPGAEPALPWYGEAAAPEAITKAGEALLVLLHDDTAAALEVSKAVRADADGAMPRAVARALMLAAKAHKALGADEASADEPADPQQQTLGQAA